MAKRQPARTTKKAVASKGKSAVRSKVVRSKQVAKVAPPPPPAPRADRGPVDAPGKRHRKPPPQEHFDRMMGEPQGKQMGQKSRKIGRFGGRG